MAVAFSSVPAISFLGFRRHRYPNEIPAISLPQSPAKIRQSFRLESGIRGLQVKHGLQKVFASGGSPPPSSNTDKGKVNSGSSSVADGPPLATILAGIAVFFLFLWVFGSIIMWIVGLIVNAPSS